MLKKILSLYRRFFWSPEKLARFNGVKIGSDCNIQKVSFGSEPYLIEIGDHVQITSGVKLFTHGGSWIFRKEYPKLDFFGKIKIGNNVYVGNNAMIMPGVSIGNNCIIGSGSIVTRSIPDNSIVAGNPARIVGNINDFLVKALEMNVDSKLMSYEEKRKYLLSLPEDRFIKK